MTAIHAKKEKAAETTLNIVERYLAAVDSGDNNKAMEIGNELPIDPYLAKVGRDILGPEIMAGLNLSAADAEYGAGWLNNA